MKDIGCVFECKMCGLCCFGEGGISVNQQEILRIAEFLNISETEFRKNFLEKRGKNFYIKEKDGVCVFFNKEKGCEIHPVKPDICKAWPFLKGNMVDEISFEMAKTYCPGINPKAGFKEFVEAGKKYLKENNLRSSEDKLYLF